MDLIEWFLTIHRCKKCVDSYHTQLNFTIMYAVVVDLMITEHLNPHLTQRQTRPTSRS